MIIRFLCLFLFLLINLGCGPSGSKMEMSKDKTTEYSATISPDAIKAEEPKNAVAVLPKNPDADNEIKTETKIIKTANISLEVKDYKESKIKLQAAIKKSNAYISQENETKSTDRIGNTIIIRVPKENFDNLVEGLVAVAKNVDSKNVTADDVTAVYVDTKIRLQNKKEVEKQYLEILKKAYTVEEILKVNDYLRALREEIEAKEGQLKLMNDQVAMSTITLYVYQNYKVGYGFFGKLFDAFEGGWTGLLAIIIGIFYFWPLILFIAVIVGWILISKHRKKNKGLKHNE